MKQTGSRLLRFWNGTILAVMLSYYPRNFGLQGTNYQLVKQDFTDLRLDRTFDAVVISHNTIMHVTESQLNALFRGIAAHLNRDGLLIIDTLNPMLLMELESTDEWDLEREFTAANGDQVTQFSRYTADAKQQLVRVERRYDVDDTSWSAETHYHYHHPHTLELLLEQNSIRWESAFGSYDQTPHDGENELLIIVGRRQ